LAEEANIAVDRTIYSKCRLFRAPNSRHAKSGLFKRRLSLDELTHLKPEAVIELAQKPEPYKVPAGPALFVSAEEDWAKAHRAVARRAQRRPMLQNGEGRLTAFRRRFIRDGELDPERRAVSTFRAAAELSELHGVLGFDALVHALLSEAALDSGLKPSEVKREIDCGLSYGRRQREGGESLMHASKRSPTSSTPGGTMLQAEGRRVFTLSAQASLPASRSVRGSSR
jgi:hypothetical protein